MPGSKGPTQSPWLQPGAAAPDFNLPAVHRDGEISLTDYKGRAPLLLAFFRGVYCPFCRRAIAQLGVTAQKLKALGVETLGVVASPVDRVRLYFRYRPTALPLVADPEMTTHRAFRLPKPEATPKLMEEMRTVRIDVGGELPKPLSIFDAANALDEKDRFEHTPEDNEEMEKQFPQLIGQFLLDRTGIIRWVNIEGTREGVADLAHFPTDEEFLAAARTVGG